MKRNSGRVKKQSGIALLLLLVVLILGGGYAFYRSANISAGGIQQEAKVVASLARAKEALIARAVTDANRPGSLPCPDLITNSIGLANTPGDGKADMFTLTQCPSYVGWLPWVTLDLPELTDDSGTRLWYAFSPTHRDDDSAQPINSDTATTLQLDGAGDIAAIVMAPRAALAGQNRPSNALADYLDGQNGNGDDRIFVSGPPGPAFNDMVVAITRNELMAAVEKRVASEVKACLEQHAASPGNAEHTYPWPAPLASSALRGNAGSYFGQVPLTQPGAGLESALKTSTANLAAARNTLLSASTAADQLAALQVVNDSVGYAGAFYDRLFSVASLLVQVANGGQAAFATLDADITSATANGRISRTERTALRAGALTAKDKLTALQNMLADSGIDAFPGEVQAQDQLLQQRISAITSPPVPPPATLIALQNQAATLFELFSYSNTGNPDIGARLSAAMNAAIAARNAATIAASAPGDPAKVNAAVVAAQALTNADTSLRNTIIASRVNVDATEISSVAAQLDRQLLVFASGSGTQAVATLTSMLDTTSNLISTVSTSSSPVVTARASALTALANALGATQGGSDAALIQSTTNAAIVAANALASAIAGNGDNVTRESLTAAANAYNGAQATFAIVNPPTQAAMVPYVQALQSPAFRVEYWATLIARNATDIATLARKSPSGTTENTSSAYYAADQALAGMAGSSGSLATLQAYVQTPSNTSRQAAAAAALAATVTQVDSVLTRAATLDNALDGGSANAMPMVWHGSACAFLQPPSGSTSWWTANNWANTTFYQIGDRVRPVTGRLTVNGTGNYRVVAISAGRALGTQNRSIRATANFLEGINIDASRDGMALNPVTGFSGAPLSGTFNDRLAH